MAYHICVIEPGKKRAKLWAGRGNITNRIIYAIQYHEDKKAYLLDWIQELERDNPGFKFFIRPVPKSQNIVDDDPGMMLLLPS